MGESSWGRGRFTRIGLAGALVGGLLVAGSATDVSPIERAGVAEAASLASVAQTYFVPLPEDELNATFESINSVKDGDINNIISIAVGAAGTILFYDHWEDGYDPNPTDPLLKQASTEIWGDNDAATGVGPGGVDDFSGGESVVLTSAVPPASSYRNPNTFLFDGADRVQSSFPIAMTRAAYPDTPGSLMAGAVEMLDTDSWGTSFISPVGQDTADTSGTDPFEYSTVYVQAGEDDTTVTGPGTGRRARHRRERSLRGRRGRSDHR